MTTLNSRQQEAVEYLDGACLVLAGAGSGKTRVITQKIAHLIHRGGYLPQHIAALTFTNKAALEMRERIAQLLAQMSAGKNPGRGLTIGTFHSLGLQILRQEAEKIGLKTQFSVMASDDCFALLQQLLTTTDKALIRRVQSKISLWKNGLQSPDAALLQAIDDDELQAARIYQSYAASLSAYQAVDFDDLIRIPVELFNSQPNVRDHWQRRLRYLLVDEYQDTNTCQYALIKLLVTGLGKKPMLTAVGDDDQAIYTWRGATLDNLKILQTDFPDLKVIKLEQNYRSTTSILRAANAVIANNPKLFEKNLWSEHGVGDPIIVKAMANEEAEAEQMVMLLSAHKFERRAKFSDYAVLYRSNHQARVFEQILRRERIPYVLSGGQSFFERAEIKDLISYLRLIANSDDDPAFIRAITTPKRGVGQATLEALGNIAAEWRCSLFEAVFKGVTEARLNQKQLQPLQEFCGFINRLEYRATREPAAQVLDDWMAGIAYEAYLYDTYDQRQAQNKWQNVLDFLAWLKQKSTDPHDQSERNLMELTQLIALLTMLDGQQKESDAVRLSTLHAAKGLEFGHVFLVGVEEGILPHKGHTNDPASAATGLEEERRLMYVGITRAQRSLHISWCKKRKRAMDYISCEPSRFIAEMQLELEDTTHAAQENITPQNRLANLKALLQRPKQDEKR